MRLQAIPRIIHGETTPYTDETTVITPSSPLRDDSDDIKHMIDGTYDSRIVLNSDKGSYGDYSKWIRFDIATSRKVVTVFVVTRGQ